MTQPDQQKSRRRTPEFRNRQGMAEWFDSHDTADYEDKFKPITVRFARNLSAGLSIRMDPETLAKL